MADRVALPLAAASLIARVDGAIGFTRDRSTFVDLSAWPPPIIARDEYTLDADRSPTGRWLVYARRDKIWCLRWYDAIAEIVPALEEPEPVPERDFAVFTGELDATSAKIASPGFAGARSAAEGRRGESIELAHVHRLESVHMCGEHALVVPRHVGLGDRRHPFVRRDGRWIEETSLPPFEKTTATLSDRCTTACLRLGDGTDVLVWDGHVFAYDGVTFTPRFEERLELEWFHDYTPVAFGRDSIFAACKGELVELTDSGLRRHLPGVRVTSVHRGPAETLLVARSGGEVLLYDPIADAVAEVSETQIGKHGTIVGVSPDGGLVVWSGRDDELRRIAATQLATLPRRRASVEPEVVPVEPLAIVDELGATSRPQIAARGDRVVVGTGKQLRFHREDVALSALVRRSPVIAVACSATHTAALHASGTLLELGAPPGRSHTFPGNPRSLAVTADGRWIVLTRKAVSLVDFDALVAGERPIDLGVPRALAAACDENNTILVLAEDGRIASWSNGVRVDVPPTVEQLIACAAVGPGRFVCVGRRHLFMLDLETRELEALRDPAGEYVSAGGAYIATSHERVAWCSSSSAVAFAVLQDDRLTAEETITFPPTFSAPADEPLAVHGLAFLDHDRLAIALDHGRGNIVDLRTKSVCKLDPHRGDATSRWILIYGGEILIAG